MHEFPEKDWKLFRKKLPVWQEEYMCRLCKEYMELLGSDQSGAERFWELEKRVKEDQKKTGVIAQRSRSKMMYNLVNLLAEGAITMDDLDEFSDDVKETVKMFARL